MLGFDNNTQLIGSSSYKSDYPVKLLKKRDIYMSVDIVTEEVKNITIPLFLDKNEKTYYIKSILNASQHEPLFINEINIDFGSFNHRGYPFTVLVELTQLNLI